MEHPDILIPTGTSEVHLNGKRTQKFEKRNPFELYPRFAYIHIDII